MLRQTCYRAFLALFLPAVGLAQAQRADRLELIVASTTDVHGRLRGWDYYADAPDSARGLSRAATIVDSLRKAHPGRVVLVDAGDLLQGNPLTYVAARVRSASAKGEPHPVIAAMNAMRYDAAALGNHEFNYGLSALRAALGQARFPFLAANYRATSAQGRLPVTGAILVTRGPIQVGIVGATNPGVNVWDRDHVRGAGEVGDIVTAVRREVQLVRRRGADVVVVVMHTGLAGAASYDTVATRLPSENVGARVARDVAGIDLIVLGHSHREVADTTINGVLIVQPRNWATSVSAATLSVARDPRGWQVVGKRGAIVRAAGHAEHPSLMRATAAAHTATMRWVNEPLGATTRAWRADSARVVDSPLIDFVLEVARRTAGTDLAAGSVFDLDASLDSGAITVAEVARLYPYDNTLRAVRITGRQLREYLEFSTRYYRTIGTAEAAALGFVDQSIPGYNFDIVAGADYTLDLSKPMGQRVTRLEVKGRPVGDGDSFTLALNNYRQTGGGGFAMLAGAPVVYDNGEEMRELLIAEVKRRGMLRAEDYHTVNWRIEPAAILSELYRAVRSGYDAPATTRTVSPGTAGADRGGPGREAESRAVRIPAHLRSGRWLRVIGTNDFHGGLEPGDYNAQGVVRGGGAHLISAIEHARRECAPPSCVSLWVDGGDQWQGSPASNATAGRPVTELFNRFDLAASALGNHELDWGLDTLRVRLPESRYRMMAINVLDTLGRDVPWIPNDTLIALGGVMVGVIGVLTREAETAARREYTAAFRFVDPVPLVDRAARALRARGAEAIVIAAHAGAACDRDDLSRCEGEIIDLATRVTERIDAIVAGHSHRPTATLVRGTPITQAYTKGTAIGVIDVPLGDARGAPQLALRNVRPDSIAPNAEAAALIERATAPVRERFARVVAHLAEPIRRGTNGSLGELIADAQRAAARGDVAVMNSGGVRTDLKAGPITENDIFQMQPFGNVLVRIRLRGADLRAYLERVLERSSRLHLSGVTAVYDTSQVRGRRLTRATMADGRPLDDGGQYVLVLSDFLAGGGDGLNVQERALAVEQTEIVDRDAFVAYVRSLPQPVRAPPGGRVERRE
jgi:2',3'-cyclic-nucleotide 2'-phosphodiesterase/3'-nucleotidase